MNAEDLNLQVDGIRGKVRWTAGCRGVMRSYSAGGVTKYRQVGLGDIGWCLLKSNPEYFYNKGNFYATWWIDPLLGNWVRMHPYDASCVFD